MPKNKLFLPVSITTKVEITRKAVPWWTKPYAALALFFIHLGFWMSGAEVIVRKQTADWNKAVPEINVDEFMKDEPGSIRSKYGDLG